MLLRLKAVIEKRYKLIGSFIFLCLISVLILAFFLYQKNSQFQSLQKNSASLASEKEKLSLELSSTQAAFTTLKNEDQVKKNNTLQEEINNIQTTFKDTVTSYEQMLSLGEKKINTTKMSTAFAKTLSLLSQRKYTDAKTSLADLNTQIKTENDKLAAAATALASAPPPASAPVNNTPPSGGYQRQSVQTDAGTFTVDIISADINSTRVIVDTASDSDCRDNCPVLSLADYVGRNGAFAGINGSYFCPATYPSCAGKTNSYDTLLMNKNKKYFNSDNNVYSTIPLVVFQGSSIRFLTRSMDWGRDTSPDSLIANYPLLTLGNNLVYGGDGEAKHNNKGGRSFVGSKGSTVYIGVVNSATVMESAKVMKALGIENSLNLDDGGSTSLWYGGYKSGPGRNLPNAILLVKR